MYQSKYQQKKPSVFKLLMNVVLFVFLAVFTMVTVSTGDPLWFWTSFDAQPAEIVLNCYGEEIVLEPGSAHFDQLTALFNENFSGFKNWDSLSMSEETWAYYQESDEMVVLVFSYPEVVRVHSTYKYFSGIDTLIIPLDGRHSQYNAVFGMTDEVPAAGAMHIPDRTPVNEYVFGTGLCQPSVTLSSN